MSTPNTPQRGIYFASSFIFRAMNKQNPPAEMSISEVFEGPNSSLKKTFDAAVAADFDLPEPPPGPKASKPKVHIGGSNVCVSCEG